MRMSVNRLWAAVVLGLASNAPAVAAPDHTLGAALMFAVVNADGSLARGSGARSSGRGFGFYVVEFDRDVSGCACTATIGGAALGNAALIEIATNDVFPTNISVVAYDRSSGSSVAMPFHLTVMCAR